MWQEQTHIPTFLLGSSARAEKQLSVDKASVHELTTVSTQLTWLLYFPSLSQVEI